MVLKDGTHQPPERHRDGIPILTARNVSSGHLRLTKRDTFISSVDASLLERSLKMEAGDVLLSVKGTIGATALVQDRFPRAVLDRNLALLRPRESLLASEWLLNSLRTSLVQEQIRTFTEAAAQPGLPLGTIAGLTIPMPPIKEQFLMIRNIQQALGSTDDVVDCLVREQRLVDERRDSLITAAVTGQIDVTTARGVA